MRASDVKANTLKWLTDCFLSPGRFCSCLVDSGSFTSAISSQYAHKLNLNIEALPKDSDTIRSASSSVIKLEGKTSINIFVDDCLIVHDVFVINNLCKSVILGLDFLKKYSGNLNYEDGTMALWIKQGRTDRRITIPFVREEIFKGVARLSRPIVLGPGAKKIVPVFFKHSKRNDCSLQQLPSPYPFLKFVGEARTPKNKRSVGIVNLSNQVRRLKPGLPLACVVMTSRVVNIAILKVLQYLLQYFFEYCSRIAILFAKKY